MDFLEFNKQSLFLAVSVLRYSKKKTFERLGMADHYRRGIVNRNGVDKKRLKTKDSRKNDAMHE